MERLKRVGTLPSAFVELPSGRIEHLSLSFTKTAETASVAVPTDLSLTARAQSSADMDISKQIKAHRD